MKKKWIGMLAVVLLIVAGIFVYQKKKEPIAGTELLSDIKLEDISCMEVRVVSLETYVAFNDHDVEEMSEVMNILKNIEAKPSRYSEIKGCGVHIDISMKDGTKHTVGLVGKDMFLDGKHYTPNDNYVEAFRNLVNKYNTVNPVAEIEESDVSYLELNTSTDITIKLDTKKSERISEIMDSLKSIEVKSVKYPTFRCDTCITIKMKDGTEHSLGFGSEDMVFDGKYYKPDDNYKEIWNQWAFEYHNEDTIESNTDDTMESTGYLSDEVQREYVKVNDILYCYSGKTSESLEQIEAKGFVLVGKVALCDNEKIPEMNFTAAQIEKGTVIYANENEKDYIYLEIDGELLVFEEEK